MNSTKNRPHAPSHPSGLTKAEVLASRERHGNNVLPRQKRQSFISAYLSSFKDPVIRVLLLALCANIVFLFRTANIAETVGIAVSIAIATLISTLSERSSEAAYDRLASAYADVSCRAVRDSVVVVIPTSEVVVGDILLLAGGEEVAADGVLISGRLTLNMSSMTGESRDVEKLPSPDRSLSPSSPSSLLRGCTVTGGEGVMRVLRVGAETFLGLVSSELSAPTRPSPLKTKLTRLAGQISRLGYASAAIVCAVCLFDSLIVDSGFSREIILSKLTSPPYLFSRLLEALTLALSIVVVAVPEGLPTMIAVVLSSNVKRMLRDGVLVKKAVGIEAAGSMNILFCDKTGTLTEGRMSLEGVLLPSGEYKLPQNVKKSDELYRILTLCALYNTSSSVSGGSAVGGNFTDRALLDALLSASHTAPFEDEDIEVLEKIPFDSALKYSAVALRIGGERFSIYKGAAEILMPRVRTACGFGGEGGVFDRHAFSSALSQRCLHGSRAILLALSRESTLRTAPELPRALTLVCAVLLCDPVRRTTPQILRELAGGGVDVVMVTGDSRETALAVARKSGLITPQRDLVLDSGELSRMSDSELCASLDRLVVVARALPSDKSRLVRIAEESGRVTGMTGDGINDAPALKNADVGFAMGSGSAVARDAADIVIQSDDLEGISNAVLYGRNIFKSIRKFITLQLTVNLCAVCISMLGPFIGVESPVTVLQMLWLNIIMDTLGGLAFAGEAAHRRIMKEQPKGQGEPILNGYMTGKILFLGVFTLILSVLFLTCEPIRSHFAASPGDIRLLTGFFVFFIFAGIFNCFNARCDRLWLFSGLADNAPFIFIIGGVAIIQLLLAYLGHDLLRTVPLSADELLLSLSLALAVLPVGTAYNLLWRLFGKEGKRGGY